MAYGTVDLGLSIYGATRLIVKPEAWKLFNYVRTDKIRAYEATSAKTFMIERMVDGLTAESMYTEWENHYDK
ncbi:DUF4225 domain-containing protein [Pseudomonas alliivorans]|nr:DUF4225 domain-containing protein [Pseudomonas alliivorans]